MRVSQLIEHLQQSYKPDDFVAYDLWSVDDVMHENDSDHVKVTKEQAEEVLGRMQRYKDCTIGMNWDVLNYHLSDVMLEAETGPPHPQDGVLNLTDDQFIARYKPETDEHGNYYRQRDWTVPEDQVEIEKATKEHRIWTAGDDDNGNFCISSGWHFVNRLYYIITEIPLENPDWIVQVPSDEEELSDHMQKLTFETDTAADEWESMDGPQTGVGVEFWYRHDDGREAYVVDDQGEITIEINSPGEQETGEEAYILWESSGSVETFDSEDEAKNELMAMESRGLRGLIYRDKADALSDAQDRVEAIKAAQLKDEKRGLYPDKEDVSN